MQKPRVLLIGEIDFAHDEWNALSDIATLEVRIGTSRRDNRLADRLVGGGF